MSEITADETIDRSVQLRRLVVAALKAYKTLAKDNVVELGDQPTDTTDICAQILVYDGHEQKVSGARAQPNFTSTSFIMLDCRLDAPTLAEARQRVDKLSWQVKQAVLTSYDINLLLQQVSTVSTQKKITTNNSGKHVGSILIEFGMEYFEAQEEYYMPVAPSDIDEVVIHADLINVADKLGTYPNPPFPDAVVPAPRTEGPDGRDEGLIKVDVVN